MKARLYRSVAGLLEGDAEGTDEVLKEFWEECSPEEIEAAKKLLGELIAELKWRADPSTDSALLKEAQDLLYSHAETRARNAESDAARWKKIAFTDYDALRLAAREVMLLWESLSRTPDSEVLKQQHEAAQKRLKNALEGVPTIGVPVRVILGENLAKVTAQRDLLLKQLADLKAKVEGTP